MTGTVVAFDKIKSTNASIKPLVDETSGGISAVNKLIADRTGSSVTLIPEVARYLIDSGGKRLRPMLTLASATACGLEDDNAAAVMLATSVEFMHTATLFHDDVVDESDRRRGKDTARLVWGNQESVLVGDYLLGQAFRLMVEVGSMDGLDVLSKAATIIAEGEVMQLVTAKNIETTEDEYLDVIRSKTAALFSAAAEVGPIIAESGTIARSAFRSYGANLGIAFQLIDDALDYGGSSPKMGKRVGDDFREGKVTLPVVLAYRRSSQTDRQFWKSAIEDGDASKENLARALAMLEETGALADTVERARHYGDMALDALAPTADSSVKAALQEAVEFCISRAH